VPAGVPLDAQQPGDRIADFPDEASASAFALGTGMAGRLTTETMRAYSAEETDAIFARLPPG
jgi:uncharacterized protein with GYD domain